MFVSEQHQFIYISIPKTGSRSMRRWLSRNYQTRKIHQVHAWNVPEKYKSYFIFTLVSNPYDRCISLWKMEGRHIDFTTYMKNIIFLKENPNQCKQQVPEQYMSQKPYIQLSNCSKYIKLECLQELELLPFVHSINDFPHFNRRIHRAIHKNNLTQEQKQIIWEYCLEDFDFLDYKV